MLHFSSSFKLALSVLGLFILAVASAPGSFTRSTLGLLARDAREHGHHYVAPTETDSRSPCPALNVLANHGYLPRDGRNIGPFDLVYALQDAYQIDTKLSHVLAIGGFGLIHADTLTELPAAPPNPIKEFKAFLSAVEHAFVPKKLQREAVRLRDYARSFLSHRTMDLHYIGLHGHIEHDASITHDDAPLPTSDFARWASNTSLFDAFMADAPGSHVDLATISAARVRREAETQLWSGRTLDGLHADIARGEAALVIGILGETLPDAPAGVSHVGTQWDWAGLGVHKDVMRTFWQEERLPAGWKPLRVTSAQSTDKGKKIITAHMDKLRAAQAARANTTTYFVDGAQAVLA